MVWGSNDESDPINHSTLTVKNKPVKTVIILDSWYTDLAAFLLRILQGTAQVVQEEGSGANSCLVKQRIFVITKGKLDKN